MGVERRGSTVKGLLGRGVEVDLEEVVGLSVERDGRSRLEEDLRGTVPVVGDRRLDGLGIVDRQRVTARREATSGVEVNRALVRVGRVGCE